MNSIRRLMELAGIKLDEVGDHYDELEDNQFLPDPYHARNIVWMGESGRMVKVTPKNSEPIWGNIFHEDKIRETAQAIKYSEDTVKFNAPLAHISILDIQDVKENIEAAKDGDLMFDPVIDDVHRYSTGDDELDRYIVDPEEFLEVEAYDDEHKQELHAEMESMIKQATAEQWGDIGNLHIQIRDGNHRRAAAFMAGEPFVWAIVATDGVSNPSAKKHMQ